MTADPYSSTMEQVSTPMPRTAKQTKQTAAEQEILISLPATPPRSASSVSHLRIQLVPCPLCHAPYKTVNQGVALYPMTTLPSPFHYSSAVSVVSVVSQAQFCATRDGTSVVDQHEALVWSLPTMIWPVTQRRREHAKMATSARRPGWAFLGMHILAKLSAQFYPLQLAFGSVRLPTRP